MHVVRADVIPPVILLCLSISFPIAWVKSSLLHSVLLLCFQPASKKSSRQRAAKTDAKLKIYSEKQRMIRGQWPYAVIGLHLLIDLSSLRWSLLFYRAGSHGASVRATQEVFERFSQRESTPAAIRTQEASRAFGRFQTWHRQNHHRKISLCQNRTRKTAARLGLSAVVSPETRLTGTTAAFLCLCLTPVCCEASWQLHICSLLAIPLWLDYMTPSRMEQRTRSCPTLSILSFLRLTPMYVAASLSLCMSNWSWLQAHFAEYSFRPMQPEIWRNHSRLMSRVAIPPSVSQLSRLRILSAAWPRLLMMWSRNSLTSAA